MDKRTIKRYAIFVLIVLVATNILYFSIFGIVKGIHSATKGSQETKPTPIVDEVKIKDDSVLTINVNTITVSEGETDFLSASVSGVEGACPITYKSSDEKIVTVDSGGRIDGVAEGSAVITASYQGLSAECKVTVAPSLKPAYDLYSTAITANQDALLKNVAKNGEQSIYGEVQGDGTSYEGVKPLYKLVVSIPYQCVTVYTYDENDKYTIPIRAMVCSTGLDDGTPVGEYTVSTKLDWGALYGDVYGQYITQFYGDFLFHSVPYHTQNKDDLKVEEYNKLGQPASLGCVRLAISDTRWIFENCIEGTEVVVTKDKKSPPLGVPASMKLTDFECKWDPTQSDSENPYNGKTPTIEGAEDIILEVGSNFNASSGITAYDTCHNDITNRMNVIGRVNTGIRGKYLVTYEVEDYLHRTCKKTITVTVQ